ncbi:MAG: FAD-dependent oxidoreductase, partial [Anaerolineales bacterium]
SSHKEGCQRHFNVSTQRFSGKNGEVQSLHTTRVVWNEDDKGGYQMSVIPDSEKEYKADLVLLAMGFLHVETDHLVSDLGLELNERGNLKLNENYMTNIEGVFAAGDSKRGASLVVWAIHEGKQVAKSIHAFLKKSLD